MSENGENLRPGIEMITMDKETGIAFTLGKNGPEIEVVSDPESESGLSATYNGEKFALHQGANTIGRLENSDIVVNLPTVSREHAIVRIGDSEYSVADAGSTNGTYLA